MEYIKLEDKRLSVHGDFNANFYNNYALSTILQEGEKTARFDELEKTSRSMWPERETVGITFEEDDFEIDIQQDSVRIRLDNIFNFDSVYDDIQTMLCNTSIDIPPKKHFKTDMISFYNQSDEYHLTYDETKCEPSQEFGTECYLKTDSVECTYSQTQGIVTFSLSERLNPKEVRKSVESILDQDIIILSTDGEIRRLNKSF